MRYLITGANGFIGSRLAVEIKRREPGAEVFLLDINLSNTTLSPSDFNFLEHDLLSVNANDLPAVDVIIHAAALLGVGFVNSNPLSVVLSNIAAFAPLVNYITNPSVKFVFFSTSEVYGDGVLSDGAKTILRENHPEQPLPLPDLSINRSSYALSKIVGEFMASRSEDFLCLRPHNIYGPNMGSRHVIPNLIEKVSKASKSGFIEIYNPTHVRSFCYIDDAVSQILNLIEAGTSGNFNIGNPEEPVEIETLANKILELMGVDAKIIINSEDLGSPAFRKPIVHHHQSTYVDLDLGLRKMVESYAPEWSMK